MTIPTPPDPIPLCPVSGRPAARRVQWVTSRLLIDLWRIEFGADVRPCFAGIERFGLWESPIGLYFFDPPCEGDRDFYAAFYAWPKQRGLFADDTTREEFRLAARRIAAGARVLDVGCGRGAFRQCVPHADYVGLDPYFADDCPIEGVRPESLEAHLIAHGGVYDAVCCFQVIEHVRDPKALFAGLVRAAKPGGLICVGAPHAPSALTRIPNFLMSAPPHHLTWWNRGALYELAAGAGVEVESVEAAPWGPEDAIIYWIGRMSPIQCSEIYFRGAASWHLAALLGYALGRLAFRVMGRPKTTDDEGAGLLMIARKPAR